MLTKSLQASGEQRKDKTLPPTQMVTVRSAMAFPQNPKTANEECVERLEHENAKIKEKLGVRP
jgi:hypothetical protein